MAALADSLRPRRDSGVLMPDFLPRCDTRVGHILALVARDIEAKPDVVYLEADAMSNSLQKWSHSLYILQVKFTRQLSGK